MSFLSLMQGATHKSPRPPSRRGSRYDSPFWKGAGGIRSSSTSSRWRVFNTGGFTLIEIILSILIIGISIPAIMTAFSGITASNNPEFAVQASFLAQKHMEKIAGKKSSGPNSISTCADIFLPATEGNYTLTCTQLEDVTALDPDTTGVAGFGKKLTLTIGRTDDQMTPVDFFALF